MINHRDKLHMEFLSFSTHSHQGGTKYAIKDDHMIRNSYMLNEILNHNE